MKRIGDDMARALREMGADSSEARLNMRASQVRNRYRAAIESVYGKQAQLFLDHTNNVYIMRKNDVVTLIVYVEESIYAAELNAQRELIKLKLLELFGEQIEDFEIHVSRGSYKGNHPFSQESDEAGDEEVTPMPLDADEEALVSDAVSRVSDERLAENIRKAMTANMEWRKGEMARNRAK